MESDVILALNGQPVMVRGDVQTEDLGGARLWQVDLIRERRSLRLRFRL